MRNERRRIVRRCIDVTAKILLSGRIRNVKSQSIVRLERGRHSVTRSWSLLLTRSTAFVQPRGFWRRSKIKGILVTKPTETKISTRRMRYPQRPARGEQTIADAVQQPNKNSTFSRLKRSAGKRKSGRGHSTKEIQTNDDFTEAKT